jgi:hypothetical protein
MLKEIKNKRQMGVDPFAKEKNEELSVYEPLNVLTHSLSTGKKDSKV